MDELFGDERLNNHQPSTNGTNHDITYMGTPFLSARIIKNCFESDGQQFH